MISRIHFSHPAAACVVLTSLLIGCTVQDRRLTEDEQSCRSMGHSPDTTSFKQCLADLDQRRCAVGGPKSGRAHLATMDCTKLH